MTRITQADKEDFRNYCRGVTDAQLREVYRKEKTANRRSYAAVALAEMERRNLC